jgi:short-subunit dehydrogenase
MSFSQSLRALSTAYGIRVSCICPGFIETGMAGDLLAAGSSVPSFMLASSDQMAQRIKEAIEDEQPGAIWPLSHGLPLVALGRLNWLNADLSRWLMSKIGVAGQMVT